VRLRVGHGHPNAAAKSDRDVYSVSMTESVAGRIVRGQGLATGFLSDPLFARAIGRPLHQGTINLLVPDQHGQRRFIVQPINPQAILGVGHLQFCPCTLDGQVAFILSTWHPGESYHPYVAHHGYTLIEIMADRRLQLGSTATVKYDPSHLQVVKV
jgi:hypothetical protein